MGNYDDIGLPVKGQPISSGAFGIKVRNYLINADARLSAIEGSLLPRYYIKANATARNTTTTAAADSGTGLVLSGIPLEVGSYEVELILLFNFTTTGTQGIKTTWAFSGTSNIATVNRNCLGPGDSGTGPNANATIMSQAAGPGTGAQYFTAANAAWSSAREALTGLTVTAAGNLSLNWAQSVSSANNTTLQAGSYFRITRYA